jgi:hypothetical protein
MQATIPPFLVGTSMAGRFCYWQGESGQRYLTRVFACEAVTDFPDSPVVLAAIGDDGKWRAVWAGLAGTSAFERAIRTVAQGERTQAHIHLLARTSPERKLAARDLAAGLGFRDGGALSGKSDTLCQPAIAA